MATTSNRDRRLTDDVLTLLPRAASVRAYLREAVDQLAGADPGLTQLRLALQAVLGIVGGVALAYALVRTTGALQLSAAAGPSAAVAAANHALLLVAMLISAIVAMMAGFTVTDQTARGQVLSSLWLPIPMLVAMTISLALGSYRVASLVWLVVLMSAAVYARRFGPRGNASGMVAFNGGFLGFFLHADIKLRDVGVLAALLALGVAASMAVRFSLFRPDLLATLRRMRRSWRVRADRLLDLAVAVLDSENPAERDRRAGRLARQVVRLNECTLMVDAQLADAIPTFATTEAQRLFDADLSLSNVARFSVVLAERCADAHIRRLARDCVAALLDAVEPDDATSDTEPDDAILTHVARLRAAEASEQRMTVVAHRLAASARDYAIARARIGEAIDRREAEAVRQDDPFEPAVTLTGGYLPGSGPVSTEASTTPGRGGVLDRTTLPPYLRATVQAAVAGTIAVTVGDIVSASRLYWAVLAAFLAFMATSNSGEQVRKAIFRAGGTAIGIVLGDVLVHVTGAHIWSSLLIVVVALFFGIYLIRINYTFMAIGITVTLSQLYVQLGEFSWHLLLLRLIETVIGVGAVVLTVLVVVPLRPQRVLTTGVLLWFRSLATLVDGALTHLLGGGNDPVRAHARELDSAYAALESTAINLRRSTFGRNSTQLAEIRSVSAAARNYARSFAVGASTLRLPDNGFLAEAAGQMRVSMAAIDDRIESGNHGTYTRSAALAEQARHALDGDRQRDRAALVLRDLALLDGALARLAGALQMAIADHDTTDQAAR